MHMFGLVQCKHQLVRAKQMYAACARGVDGATHSMEYGLIIAVAFEDATNKDHLTRFL